MLNILKVLLTSVLMLITTQNVMADEALAKSKNCLACHSVDAKLIGPAYKDVAARYKGEEGAAEKLAEKLRSGGSGVWGKIPMPPNPVISDEDLKTLINWILSL